MALWSYRNLRIQPKTVLDPSTFVFSGGAFSSGADQGAFGGALSGSAGAAMFGSRPAVSFNGSSQQLVVPSNTWTASDDVFIFAVVQANKLNPGALVSQAWGTATTGWVLYPSLLNGGSTNGGQKSWVSGDSVAFGAGFGSSSVQNVTIGHSYTSNAAYHLLALNVGAASLYRLDGVAQTPGAVQGANPSLTAAVIWGNDALNEWFTGNIAFGLVGATPGADEIQRLEGWASWYFTGSGSMLPSTHPFFLSPPLTGSGVLRAPNIQPILRADWRAAVFAQDALVSSPARFNTIAPFAQTDWANPRGPAFPIEGRGFVDGTDLELIGQDNFPPGLAGDAPDFDWPNPLGLAIRAGAGRIENRTWLDSFKLELLGQDALPAGGPDYDWPNPLAYARDTAQRTHLDALRLNLLGQDALPFRLSEWPLRAAPRPPAHDPGAVGLTLALAVLPPSLLDWPNPRGATPGIALRTHLDLTRLVLIGQDARLVGQAAFELPPRGYPTPTANRTHLDALRLNLLGQDAMAPGQQSWEVPPRGAASYINRGHIESLKLNLLGRDAMVVGAQHFDLAPRCYPVPVANRTWLEPLRLNLIGRDAMAPGAQAFELPSRGYPIPVVNRTHLDALRLNLLGQDAMAFRQADWPLPRVAGRLAHDADTLSYPALYTVVIAFPPISQADWPVPRGASRWVALGAQDGVEYSFLGQLIAIPILMGQVLL